MRITIAMGPYFPVPTALGGAVEKIQLGLAEAFAARGHAVTVISRAFADFPQEEVRDGVRHIRVPSWDAPRSRFRFRLYDLLYARRVARVLPDSDVTVTNSFFLPLVLPRKRAGRLYVHVARYPKRQLWLYRRADRLQTVSAAVADAIRKQTPSLAGRVTVIPYPLTGALAPPISSERLVARPRTILYVGRIAKEKGLHVLIEAFAQLADGPLAGYTLRIVGPHEFSGGGDGPDYFRRLQMLASPVKQAVVFDGLISNMQDLREIYEASDIFVYPSLAEKGEAFGAAPLEAMAAGCRVLVSDLACFREYLEPDCNGRVFDHRRDAVASLATALMAMIGETAPMPMREAAVATAARFQMGPIADRFINDFAEVMKAHGTA
jgi:glycosyltransferase involved in cell wall biosynthesis